MNRLKLLGAAGLAASLMAAPAFAATDTMTTKPAPAATSPAPAMPATTAAAAPNMGAAPGSDMYATVGQGGYTADQAFITSGETKTNNARHNASASNLRPSERNADLADNGSARASKVIGTTVYNTANQKLGSVNDILISKSGKLFAVITTNQKKVGVPFDQLKFGDAQNESDNKLVLPNETQTRLNTEAEIHYNESHYQAWKANHNGNNNEARENETGVRANGTGPIVGNRNNTHG